MTAETPKPEEPVRPRSQEVVHSVPVSSKPAKKAEFRPVRPADATPQKPAKRTAVSAAAAAPPPEPVRPLPLERPRPALSIENPAEEASPAAVPTVEPIALPRQVLLEDPMETDADYGEQPLTGFESVLEPPSAAGLSEYDPDDTADPAAPIGRDELLEEIPELAAFYAEFGEPPELMQELQTAGSLQAEDFPQEMSLTTRLELELFNEASVLEPAMPEASAVAPEVLSETPAERPALTVLLKSLEPEQADAARSLLSTIVCTAREIRELPTDGDEAAETEKLVKEQVLEQWCGRLLDCLNVEPDEETIKRLVSLLTQETEDGVPGGQELDEALTDRGTHEHKAADTLTALMRLAHDIKQRLHLPIWLGRYTLRVAAA